MTMRFSVSVTPQSNGRTIALHVEQSLAADPKHVVELDMAMSSDLIYERITEVTNNTVRRMVNKLEPEIQRLRQRHSQGGSPLEP